MQKGIFAAVVLALVLPACAQDCVRVGAWAVPQEQRTSEIGTQDLLERASRRDVVLLGEAHDEAEHHRWQLHTLAALHGRRSDLVLGFEMFPRRVQPVLDQWVQGRLSVAAFLEQSDWARVWGFDPSLYLPLFHFARMHRIPMVALNVERALIREIGKKGADAVPEAMREGVGAPAPVGDDYLRDLFFAYTAHAEDNKAASMDDPAFGKFVEGQLTWDRAMAEAINTALVRYPGRQVIGVMGQGHTRPGGVPLQLRALGVENTMVLLPWDRDAQCAQLTSGLADAVFGVGAPKPGAPIRRRLMLGVVIESVDDVGVRIRRVSKGSVAEQAGLMAGDVVLTIAGREVRETGDIIAAVGRQAPGTWLPLRIRREGSEVDIVAKFPPARD